MRALVCCAMLALTGGIAQAGRADDADAGITGTEELPPSLPLRRTIAGSDPQQSTRSEKVKKNGRILALCC